LSYKEDGGAGRKKFKDLGIKTDEDYLQKMPLFAVRPVFKVLLKSNSQIKERYQYRTSTKGRWVDVAGDSFEWSALNKTNELEVRSINEFGRSGPITFMKVGYK
jgi:hypothetical protein